MRAIHIFLLTWLTLATSTDAAAGTGLDPRFGSGGVVLLGTTPVSGQHIRRPNAIAMQADGKILLAGRASGQTPGPNPQPTYVAAVARLDANGGWDTTFGDHGLYAFPGDSSVAAKGGEANQVALMSDGSIVASGGTYATILTGNNFHTCTLMFKLTSAGVLDANFGGNNNGAFCYDFAPEPPNLTTYSHPTSIQIGAADVIYMTTPGTNLPQGAVARFTPAGILDGSYGSNGIAKTTDSGIFLQLVLQQDQQLIATSGRTTARFTTSGNLDPTFGTGGEFIFDFGVYGPAYANSVKLDVMGRVITGLYNFSNNPSYAGYLFTRLTMDGSPDNTFNGSQQQPGTAAFASVSLTQMTGEPYMIAAQPMASGGIFAVGEVDISGSAMGLMRLNADSSFDSAYGDSAHPGWAAITIASGGPSAFNAPYAVTQDASGRLVIFGNFNGTNIGGGCVGLVRVIPDQLFADGLEAAPATPTCPP